MNIIEELDLTIKQVESVQSGLQVAGVYRGTGRFTRQLAARSTLAAAQKTLARAAAALEADMRTFSQDAITVHEFRSRIEGAHQEIEVRRLVLYFQEKLMGSAEEVNEVMDLANARAVELLESGAEIGAPGGRAADFQAA